MKWHWIVGISATMAGASVGLIWSTRGSGCVNIGFDKPLCYHVDPDWLGALDAMTIAPAEISVGGSVFLSTLLLGVAVSRWRADEDS